VYHATHAQSGEPAAAKLLDEHFATSPVTIQRFEREIEVIERIRHPNVVQILEHGRDGDDLPYLMLELLTGSSLADHLTLTGPLSVEETWEILEPLASALDAAHDAGVIHRDIKASNVFLAVEHGRRRVILLDFGIAKLLDVGEPALTGSRELVGTPSCMSPEQICGGPVDARTDVYGLGVLVFRMLAGGPPFLSRIFSVLQQLHLRTAPPSLNTRVPVRPSLDAVILRAMSKDPRGRHATAGAFAGAFRGAMGAPATAEAASQIERSVLAVHVAVHAPSDELTVDTDTILQSVIADLAAARLSLIGATGESVLFSLDLPADPEQARRERSRVVEALLAISRALAGPFVRGRGIRVRLSCHVGELVATPNGEPISGDVLDMAGWVTDVGDEGVFASPEALLGLGLTPQASTGTGGAHLRISGSEDDDRVTAPCAPPPPSA
jgi:eukaryotic-like serine/threonine-protein kinase